MTRVIPIPTEPIGSIPRPPELIEAVAERATDDPSLDPLYEEAIRDTVERFEATGSPVITDGEQRKYHNFWTYSVRRAAEHRTRRLQDPVRGRPYPPHAAAHRAARFATSATRTASLDVAQRYRDVPVKQAVISPSALSLMYPAERDPRLPARAVHRRPAARARDRDPALSARGRAQGADRLHRGPPLDEDRPVRASAQQLHRPEQPRAVAVLGRGAPAHRRAHLPGRRPRLDAQRGRRLRGAAAQPVRAEGGELLRRARGREGPRARAARSSGST